MTMDIQEIKQKKQELNDKIAELLRRFEEETNVEVSDIGFVRIVHHSELGREVGKVYEVEAKVEL